MWDLRKKFSHGRLSVRRISLLATTLVLAIFMATVGSVTPALAADATRTGSTVSYSGKTFTELKSTDKLPSGLPPKTSGYESIDTSGNKTYFILTTGDPSSANSGQYVYYDGLPTSNFSNPSPPVTVSIANGAPAGAAATAGAPTTCDGSLTNGIGYILCPVVNFLASGMDHLYTILSSFLEVQPVKTGTDSSLYRMWAVVRDIANISFVIGFLVIVYSQVTSVGISNYNIKRMLPRLIVAAILVNISYWVSSVAVDISNLLGYSIHDLFLGVFKALNTTSQYKDVKWSDISGFILSGGAVGALGAYGVYTVLATGLSGSLILLIPTLLGVLIAALVAILVMAARQALIVCLVIVSPLAFVAYLLPNTEKYFDKWKDLFMTMLLLFPIFSVLFGASQLAGLAIIQSAAGPNALNIIILGMTVMIAPVIITPMLIKFSGAFIGRMAGMVNNPKKGIMDKTRGWAQGRAQEEKAKILADKRRDSWVNRRTQAIDHRRRKREGWKKAHEMIADTKFAGHDDGMALEAASRHNTNEKQRIDNRFGRSTIGQQLEFQSRMLNTDKQAVENEFNTTHFGHQADMARRAVELTKHQVENDHEANWNNAVRTDVNLLRQNLDARSSEISAGVAKAKLDQLNAEISAQGENTEYIVNLNGITTHDRDGLLNIARDIKDNSAIETYTSMAKTVAEQKRNNVLNEIMLNNHMTIDGKTTREYAAGIGSQDEVLASAVAKERKEFAEAASYQRELASHFKLNAGEIEQLALNRNAVIVKRDDGGNEHEFHGSNDYTHDMAAEELFTVGSHGQKMALLKSTGRGQPNYEFRRTIQQAAIKSGITSIAPAIADKALDDIINGNFAGDESWQYHSFRQILEGRIKMNTLSTANAESLKLLFADIGSSNLTRTQFNQLISDNIPTELAALQVNNPGATAAEARQSLVDKFNQQRALVQNMSAEVLSNTTVRQSANSQSVEVLKQFAGNLYQGD